jgi:hypothetical protein
MQEIQLILAQAQTVLAQLAFQAIAVFGLALAWLLVAIGVRSPYFKAWQRLFVDVAVTAVAFGLLWLTVLGTAWPPLLERVGNVLGPVLAALVALVLVVQATVARALESARPARQATATWLVALGYTGALGLVVVAESWMREPVGAALIDGRFLVIDWQELVSNEPLARVLLATLFGALTVLAGVVQLTRSASSQSGLQLSPNWLRALTLLGLVASLGLLWLASTAVGAGSLGVFYDTVLQAPNDSLSGWLIRLLLVLWIITAAGLMVNLGARAARGQLARTIGRIPLVSAPLLWCLVWWHLNLQAQAALVSGLPVVDLVSSESTAVLTLGLLLVFVVVAAGLVMLLRAGRRVGAGRSMTLGQAQA